LVYIEDNTANLHLVKDIVSLQDSWTLHTATTGKSGINLVQEILPDIILLDINLPDIDGISVFHQIKALEHFSKTPIIALSAGAMEEHINQAMSAGFSDYITKPINVESLINTIKNYDNRR